MKARADSMRLRATPGPAERGVGDLLRYNHHGRSLAMDMLRGIAILLVLGRHYVVAPENLGALQPIASGWTTIGWAGVDLFFVLSGFLVSGLIFSEYQQHGRVDVRRFVIRRGFKIWPPYLVYIGVVALWLAWQQHNGRGIRIWSELWPNVLHVQNYFHTPRLHTWSLAVEEHFYLAAALVFYWILGRPRRGGGRLRADSNAGGTPLVPGRLRHLPAFVVTTVLGLAGLRHAQYIEHGAQLNLYATHLRFDGLLIGTLLAYWTHFEPARLVPMTRYPITVMVAGIALAVPTLTLSPENSAWTAGLGLTGVYVGFALVMVGWLNVAAVHGSARRLFASLPAMLLGHIGFYSYSIYLWHIDLAQTPIKKLVQLGTSANLSPGLVWVLATTAYVGAAVLSGVLLARLLEIPSLALRDRLFPRAVKPMTRCVAAVTRAPLPDTGARAGMTLAETAQVSAVSKPR